MLDHFGADGAEYTCIFTAGATAAMSLVAHSFPFREGSIFACASNAHTSMLGVAAAARSMGASVLSLDAQSLQDARDSGGPEEGATGGAPCLLGFPAESNFDGAAAPLGVLRSVRQGRWACCARASGEEELQLEGRAPREWFTFLDAAKFCATRRLCLSEKRAAPGTAHAPADMVCVSFYKIFGHPTGLGALLVSNRALQLLRGGRRYFGGGTLASLSAGRLREGGASLEDGTLPYAAIAGLPLGFRWLREATLGRFADAHAHAAAVAAWFAAELAALSHADGAPLAILYGRPEGSGSSVVTFNLTEPGGAVIGYAEVERVLGLVGVQLRSGCFCNPGACQEALGLSDADLAHHAELGKVCGDTRDLIDGKPTGALRCSFGATSLFEDALHTVGAIRRFFLDNERPTAAAAAAAAAAPESAAATVASILVYPIKSCAGVAVDGEWPLSAHGLLFDREWAVARADGRLVRATDAPGMSRIRPAVDLARRRLSLRCEGLPEVAMEIKDDVGAEETPACVRFCGRKGEGVVVGNAEVDAWLSEALGEAVRLVRLPRTAGASFANDAQLLLVSEESVEGLEKRMDGRGAVGHRRFRPNLLVRGPPGAAPHFEDAWVGSTLVIGDARAQCTDLCSRCSMVDVDPASGAARGAPVLKTLASYRRGATEGGARGIQFGVLLHLHRKARRGGAIRVGMEVAVAAAGTDEAAPHLGS